MDKWWWARFGFVIALAVTAWLALWPSLDKWIAAPAWVKKTFPGRISPGLDIKGGLRLMYEVEVDEAIRDRRDTRADQLLERIGEKLGIVREDETATREQLEQIRRRVRVQRVEDRRIRVTFERAGDVAKLDRESIRGFGDLKEVSRQDKVVLLEINEQRFEELRTTAVQQAAETISNRIDELQVRETNVQSRETDIIIEVPGEDQAAFRRIEDIISRTARLEFKIVDDESRFVDELQNLPEGIQKQSERGSAGPQRPEVQVTRLVACGQGARGKLQRYIDQLKREDKIPEDHQLTLGELDDGDDNPCPRNTRGTQAWRSWYLFARADVTGDFIEDAFVANDPQDNKPYVAVNFNSEGATVFERLTGQNVKRRMAIVLDERVESAPVIQTRIGGGRCQITLGGMRDYNKVLNEANDLVIVLRAGALPAPIRLANKQLLGASLGQDAVHQGAIATLGGILLVLMFMLLYYEVVGLVADLAVTLNVLFVLAMMAATEATLTLPGIAGIALTVAMAVDGNVLINERIREELRHGKSARAAVDQGYKRALSSIIDGHVSTLIAGVVLFQYGTGPIKGFAVMLVLGIAASLFTSIFCSRVFIDWIVRGLHVKRLRIG